MLYPANDPVPAVVLRLVVDISFSEPSAKTSFIKNSKPCLSPEELMSYPESLVSSISGLTPFFIDIEAFLFKDHVSETTVAI